MPDAAHTLTAANLSDGVSRYRIHAVARFTGIKEATLRAWERRYGVPRPGRSLGSYRLYSGLDVATILRMRDLCKDGQSAAEAAGQVRQESNLPELSRGFADGDAFGVVRRALVEAAHAFDADMATRALRLGQTLGSSVEFYEQCIAPALRDMGEAWCQDQLSIAQEHMVTDLCETTLRNLLQLSQPAQAPRLAVLSCMEHEWHALPLYGVGLRFTSWGYRVMVLGARLPASALQSAVNNLRPDVVGISITTPPAKASALRAYATACGHTPFIVGGAGSSRLRSTIKKLGGLTAPHELDNLSSALSHHITAPRPGRPA